MKVGESKKGNYNFLESYAAPKKEVQVSLGSISSDNGNPSSHIPESNFVYHTTNAPTVDNNTNYQNINFSNDFFSMSK